jgi:hypothetical protein
MSFVSNVFALKGGHAEPVIGARSRDPLALLTLGYWERSHSFRLGAGRPDDRPPLFCLRLVKGA